MISACFSYITKAESSLEETVMLNPPPFWFRENSEVLTLLGYCAEQGSPAFTRGEEQLWGAHIS
jgi:hypothetical protein